MASYIDGAAIEDYCYSPLSSQTPEFRLLKLLRGNTVKIKCQIFHAVISKHSAVSYEALSYTWGSTELVETIEINGQRLWIIESLYSALQCLRSRHEDRVMWIDAVCINQCDKVEQSRQVLEMGNIFSSATRVIFWLGKPTAEVVLLVESLNELQTQLTASLPNSLDAIGAILKAFRLNMGWSHKSKPDEWATQRQKGLKILLKRSWFKRVWILQEVLNAQSAIVRIGTLSVSAELFALSPSLFDLKPDPHVHSVLEIMPKVLASDSQKFRTRISLIDLHGKFYASEATDKRDMIFALLGMSSEPIDHKWLRPDYTKPVQEVVHNAIRYWFETTAVTIPQVLDFLVDFKSIHATYLVLPQRATARFETVKVPSTSEDILCSRDASLFVLERFEGEMFEETDAFYTEVTRLESQMSSSGSLYPELECQDVLQAISWQTTQQSVRLLVVRDGMKALTVAGLLECRQVFRFIVENCTKNKTGLLSDLLINTVRTSRLKLVLLLLEEGADVNAQGGQYCNALQAASVAGHKEIVKLLLKNGADVNAQGGYYGNALQAASSKGDLQLVKLLLEQGADLNAQGGGHGTALQAAIVKGGKGTIQLLLKNGADVNAQGGYYGNALQAASSKGDLQLVKLLLEQGADVNAQGGYYGNALQAAALGPSSSSILELLLEKGANVNAQGGEYGNALQAASALGRLRSVKRLLKEGADIHAQGGQCYNALEAASYYGREDIVQTLLNNGACYTRKR